ncbi:restriction endonuclease [Streptomyces sp. NPDC088358]|uniref:restriction endonuclease n=1 Tax=Streptomyces sp. NPDC088358 TaxID=3365857 RepID=UPI0037F826DD
MMAVLLPANAFTSAAPWAVDCRKAIAELWDTLVVVFGEGVVVEAHSSFVTATAFLRARSDVRPPLKIFRMSRQDDPPAVVKDFERLLVRGGGRVANGYVARSVPASHESLAFDLHDPALLDRRDELANFGSVKRLGDLYDSPPRVNLTANAAWLRSEEGPETVRLIGGRDIGRDGVITAPSDDAHWAMVPEEYLLAPGDLVVGTVSRTSDLYGFRAALVTTEDLPMAANHMTIVLRPLQELEPQQVRLTLMFLRTKLARALVGVPGPIVGLHQLQALLIPQPDEALATALDDLTSVKEQLRAWEAEASTVLESVFLEKTAALARSRVIGSGRTLRLRVEAASLIDDLGYTVRTRFPYPVAYRWRETEARLSGGDSQAAYGAVLDTAEILLCYSSQLALALARSSGIELGAVAAIKEKLAGGRSGPGFGDWVAVLQEVATSRKLRNLTAEHPLNDIRSLLSDKDSTDACKRLSDRRNDQAHLRRVDPVDLPNAAKEAFADLGTLIASARFLADWSLLDITDVRWDSLTRTSKVQYRELMGDHPVVPMKTILLPRNDLEAGSLYLRDPNHGLHLLRPFLIGQDCRTCRNWSTFHVDRVPKGDVLLKSLEHGHVFRDSATDTASVLRVVGLL